MVIFGFLWTMIREPLVQKLAQPFGCYVKRKGSSPFSTFAKSFLSENRDKSQNEKKRYVHFSENVQNQQSKRPGERIGISPVN
jgi:hypothetical protein